MADTGLKRDDVINHVLDQVCRIRDAWLSPSANPMKRMQILVACVFKGLDMVEIPHPDVKYNPTMLATSGDSGLYKPGEWLLELDSSYASPEKVKQEGDLALREVLDTIYHESRHHEQHMRARAYWLRMGDASKSFKDNLPIYKSSNTPLSRGLVENFGIPAKYAEGLAKMITNKSLFVGTEFEEMKKWYEESFGSLRTDKKTIMDALRQPGRRASVYDLYRTIFMEDDGWATGYKAGDAYLARSFNAKKTTVEKSIQSSERLIQSFKEKQETKRLDLIKQLGKIKREGGSQAALVKIRQQNDEWKKDEEKIQAMENKVNGAKQALTQKRGETLSLIKRHRESMTEHRLKAYSSRQGRGLYQGTAVPQ